MNKIIVEVSIGELLDKISILEIKQEKIKDLVKLKFINNEHCVTFQSPNTRQPTPLPMVKPKADPIN